MNHIVRRAARHEDFPFLPGSAIQAGIHEPENLKAVVNSALSIFRFQEATAPMQEIVGRVFSNEKRAFATNDLRTMTSRATSDFPGKSQREVHDIVQEVLVRSGLLGIIKEDSAAIGFGRLRYHVTEFEYGGPGNIAFNESNRFALHPILADWLSLKSGEADPAVVLPVTERIALAE